MKFFARTFPSYFMAGALLAVALASAGMAQTTAPTVTAPTLEGINIPIGQWLEAIHTWILPVLGVAVTWMIRKLPSQLASILITLRVDQILEKAIGYAINTVVGATKDKPLNVSTGNAVVDKALSFVVTNAPKWLIAWMGDEVAIRQKIIARLTVEENAVLTADPSVVVPKTIK